MINPNMPNIPGVPNFPGMGAMTDTLEFVKNLWGGMGIPGLNLSGTTMPGMPGMVVPTLSVEEIRKKISDLRAVETWLELNMNLLRGTIQALEVQAATIATLQSMGNALSATVSSSSGFGQPAQQQDQPAQSPGSSQKSSSSMQGSAASAASSRDEEDAISLTAPLVNAAAWWNMLQDQFRQAVSTAMAPEASAAPAAAATTRSRGRENSKGDARGNGESVPAPSRKRRSSAK